MDDKGSSLSQSKNTKRFLIKRKINDDTKVPKNSDPM